MTREMFSNIPSASIGWIESAYLRRVCSQGWVATTSLAALLTATGAPDIGATKLRVTANTIMTMNCIITCNLVTAGVKYIKRQMKYEVRKDVEDDSRVQKCDKSTLVKTEKRSMRGLN